MPDPADKAAPEKDGSGKTVIGKYTVLRKLGAGAMGEVFEAQDRRTGKRYALKLLPKEFSSDETKVTRFRAEASAAGKLTHKHIVTVHEFGQERGRLYFVMDLVEGETLQSILKRQGISVATAAKYARQVAEALAHAHAAGVIHRDIKPSNLMVDKESDIFLTDFGVAKQEGTGAGAAPDSDSGIVGTPNYMSPEQARGRHDLVDARSDVYSLGATFYEMLTRSPPFVAEHAGAVLRKVIEEDPVPPSRLNGRIPRALECVCLQAMRKSPARRYQTGSEMARDLARWQEGKPVSARPEGLLERAARWTRRHRGFVAGAALVALLSAGLGTYLPLSARAQRERKARESKERRMRASDLAREGDRLLDDDGVAEARKKYQAALAEIPEFPEAEAGLDRAKEAETRLKEAAQALENRRRARTLAASCDPTLSGLAGHVDGLLETERAIDRFLSPPPEAGDDYEGSKLNEKYRNCEKFRKYVEDDTAKAAQILAEALLLDPACREARLRVGRLAVERLKAALYYGRKRNGYAEARRWMAEAARHNLDGAFDADLASAAHEIAWKRQLTVRVSPAGVAASYIVEDRETGERGEETPLGAAEVFLPPGSYILVFRCEGYVASRVSVRIAPYETGQVVGPLTVSFAMVPSIPALEGMVFVPGGPFLFGGPGGLRGGYTHEEQTEPFFIDRTEVSVAQYGAFLDALRKAGNPEAEKRTPPTLSDPRFNRPELPVVGVSLEDARAYAAWAGKRLPRQMEWEKAARGVDGRLYPWGDRFDETRCVHHMNPAFPTLSPVGSVPRGESPYGCLDMAGNAVEWTADDFYGYPIIRGGAWSDPFDILRTNAQDCVYVTTRQPTIGFRCAKDLE